MKGTSYGTPFTLEANSLRATVISGMANAVLASATLPVLLTEAALRETTGHEPVETLLDMTVELRPIGAMGGGVSEHGSSHAIARSAFNLRLRGKNEAALR